MTITISVGSGKGGTGKSVVLSNLACLLARAGKRTCLVDLDLGGADAHIMFGLFEPRLTLTDYLCRRVSELDEVVHTLDSLHGLQLVPGSGDTLHSANMTYQEKQRLLRGVATLDADILLLDVGAGCSYHVLDFFMATDIQICVTCPEPASIMDFYRFLQLAVIRKVLGTFLSHGQVSAALKQRSFDSLDSVLAHAERVEPGAKERARKNLEYFNPLMITNRAGEHGRLNQLKLRNLVTRYLGIYVPDLGEIPEDRQVPDSLKTYLPVCEYAPHSPAASALREMTTRLIKVIDLYCARKYPADAAAVPRSP